MRHFFSVFVQVFLFLITFALGSFVLHPFNKVIALAPDATHNRSFVADGLLLMILLYVLVLIVEVVMKRIRSAGIWSTVAVLLAGGCGLLMKFGFVSTER